MLKAHEPKLKMYRTTELAEMSLLKESTFYTGLRELKRVGLVVEDSNALHVLDPAVAQVRASDCAKAKGQSQS
jgi:DNA-binding IclR family transcriptional regulator